jgi:hypothetical protein
MRTTVRPRLKPLSKLVYSYRHPKPAPVKRFKILREEPWTIRNEFKFLLVDHQENNDHFFGSCGSIATITGNPLESRGCSSSSDHVQISKNYLKKKAEIL